MKTSIMMNLGQLKLGKTPITVGSLTRNITPHPSLEKVDVFELRLDLFENQDVSSIIEIIKDIKTNFKKPLIATVRANHEGSPLIIDEEKRYKIFQNVIPLVEAIDVELSSKELLEKVIPQCKEHNALLITSYHNFEITPPLDELEGILRQSKEIGADIVKIAVKANNKDDLSQLIRFTIDNKKSMLVTISLGSLGLISRIVNPLLGSLMAYGYVDKSTAPGQISIFDIIEELRFFDSEYNQRLINEIKLLENI